MGLLHKYMDYLIFIFKTVLSELIRNKGRTILTSLGILIGVASVVLLTAFGLGLRVYIEQQFEELGKNVLRVFPGQVISGGSFRGGGGGVTSVRFTEKDVIGISQLKTVDKVTPVFTKSININYEGKEELYDLFSISEAGFSILNTKTASGRLFTAQDNNKRSKVVVIGYQIAEDLFRTPKRAIGKKIKIDNQQFTIIGVAEERGGSGFGGPNFDAYVYMPYKTAYIFNKDKEFSNIQAMAISEEALPRAENDIERYLLKEYSEDDFSIIRQEELISAISQIFAAINSLLVAIATISLVVGGIGIMNIMYVTVTEKIKEIGIKRALGARRTDILAQFLLSAIMLSIFGGLMGLVLSYIVIYFVAPFFPAYIDFYVVLIALGVSTIIGVIFGVFPAKKASDLSPMEAIRYE